MNRSWAAILVAGLMGIGLLSACASDTATTSAATTTEITVFAASSLKGPFTQLADTFQQQHPGVIVRLNVAGSADLLAQLGQGAPADVFAPADLPTMKRAEADDLVAAPIRRYASNTMSVAVPPDNPAGIKGFADLAASDVTVVVCAPVVPCGAATQRVEQRSGITLTPASEESAVADVLAKVASGEADAGVVYVTDVTAADGAVTGVPIAASSNAVNVYSIAVAADSGQAALADEFVALVTGSTGREVMADAGFAEA